VKRFPLKFARNRAGDERGFEQDHGQPLMRRSFEKPAAQVCAARCEAQSGDAANDPRSPPRCGRAANQKRGNATPVRNRGAKKRPSGRDDELSLEHCPSPHSGMSPNGPPDPGDGHSSTDRHLARFPQPMNMNHRRNQVRAELSGEGEGRARRVRAGSGDPPFTKLAERMFPFVLVAAKAITNFVPSTNSVLSTDRYLSHHLPHRIRPPRKKRARFRHPQFTSRWPFRRKFSPVPRDPTFVGSRGGALSNSCSNRGVRAYHARPCRVGDGF